MSFSANIYILHIAAFAFCLSLAVSGFMISAGLLDTANERSSHQNSVPTGGGIGLLAGLGTGLLALAYFYPQIGNHNILAGIAALALVAGFTGLIDDIYATGAKPKFIALFLICIAGVWVVGPPEYLPMGFSLLPLPLWIGFGGAVLWLFVVINAVNFMDGVNGIMASVLLMAFMFMALLALALGATTTLVLSSIMAAALAGFLPYNLRKAALIFCGDTGALMVGFVYGALGLLLVSETQISGLLYVGPLLILPFVTDVLLTLLVRARRKENLLNAHTTHIYQRLLGAGYSQIQVVLFYVLATVLCGFACLFGVITGYISSIFFLLFWVWMFCILYAVLHTWLTKKNA
jgi:UDP-N-acetylmuramyl pentapeptide phosphotransferase/UDP-N-acetylglucosamine-1-phosphate transferase